MGYLTRTLEPFHSNLSSRLVKTPKLYLLDTGLAAYLTEWSSPQNMEAGAMNGAFLETWAVTEILKSYWHNGRWAPLFFYRDKSTPTAQAAEPPRFDQWRAHSCPVPGQR